jgi:hypothetical protein
MGTVKSLTIRLNPCPTSFTGGGTTIRNADANANVPSASMMRDTNIQIYPNPTSASFNLKVETPQKVKAAIRILDVQGRLISTMNIKSNELIQFGSELRSGIYFVELVEKETIKTIRVVKF